MRPVQRPARHVHVEPPVVRARDALDARVGLDREPAPLREGLEVAHEVVGVGIEVPAEFAERLTVVVGEQRVPVPAQQHLGVVVDRVHLVERDELARPRERPEERRDLRRALEEVTGANLEESLFRLVAHDHYKDFPDYRYFTKQDDTRILAEETVELGPDGEPVMKRAAGIVTKRGGRTGQAAIIARELGIPAVVGCGDAFGGVIHIGKEVGVDARCHGGCQHAGAEAILRQRQGRAKAPDQRGMHQHVPAVDRGRADAPFAAQQGEVLRLQQVAFGLMQPVGRTALNHRVSGPERTSLLSAQSVVARAAFGLILLLLSGPEWRRPPEEVLTPVYLGLAAVALVLGALWWALHPVLAGRPRDAGRDGREE